MGTATGPGTATGTERWGKGGNGREIFAVGKIDGYS